MSAEYEIMTTAEAELSFIPLERIFEGITSIGTVRIKNTGDEAGTFAYLSVSCVNWKYTGQRPNQGQEVVTEKWIEAKVGSDPWTPIGGDPGTPANRISLTPLAPDDFVDVELRVNVPSGFSSSGNWAVIPEVSFDAS